MTKLQLIALWRWTTPRDLWLHRLSERGDWDSRGLADPVRLILCKTESIEWFIEEQAFSQLYNLAPPPCQQAWPATHGKDWERVDNLLTGEVGGGGWGRSQTIRRQESPVPYKSLNTLWCTGMLSFPANSWIFHLKTTQQLFSSSVFPSRSEIWLLGQASSQIHSPWIGDKVNSDIGMSCRPAIAYIAWRAGTTTLCWSWPYQPVGDLWIRLYRLLG